MCRSAGRASGPSHRDVEGGGAERVSGRDGQRGRKPQGGRLQRGAEVAARGQRQLDDAIVARATQTPVPAQLQAAHPRGQLAHVDRRAVARRRPGQGHRGGSAVFAAAVGERPAGRDTRTAFRGQGGVAGQADRRPGPRSAGRSRRRARARAPAPSARARRRRRSGSGGARLHAPSRPRAPGRRARRRPADGRGSAPRPRRPARTGRRAPPPAIPRPALRAPRERLPGRGAARGHARRAPPPSPQPTPARSMVSRWPSPRSTGDAFEPERSAPRRTGPRARRGRGARRVARPPGPAGRRWLGPRPRPRRQRRRGGHRRPRGSAVPASQRWYPGAAIRPRGRRGAPAGGRAVAPRATIMTRDQGIGGGPVVRRDRPVQGRAPGQVDAAGRQDGVDDAEQREGRADGQRHRGGARTDGR